jgi:hypothetical protein
MLCLIVRVSYFALCDVFIKRELNQEIYLSPTDTLQNDSFFMFTLLQRSTLASFKNTEEYVADVEYQTSCATKPIPAFPDLKSPHFLLADTYRLGSTWHFLESTFLSTFRSTYNPQSISSDKEMVKRTNKNNFVNLK